MNVHAPSTIVFLDEHPEIKRAIRCGAVPIMRDWRSADSKKLTRAERVMLFIERYCNVPEGRLVGKPMVLLPFQEAFIYCIYDSPKKVRRAILSIARKNGKTGLIAALVVAHIAGPEARLNSQIVSGAMSRKQASIVYNLAAKMVRMSPKLAAIVKTTPSAKLINGMRQNVEYEALSAEATTAHGLSPALAILDEVGQVKGPTSNFVDAIETSQGAHDDPLLVTISTQAPGDADLLSIWIDDAERTGDESMVVHVYEHDIEWDMEDEDMWIYSNPALGKFRTRGDMVDQVTKGARMPSMEARTRNLILNQRVALESLFISPSVWKTNSKPMLESAFYDNPVHIGLDLSQKKDLTAAVFCCMDDNGTVHMWPHVFAPMKHMSQRALRDKAPYEQWVKQGFMIGVPGEIVDYEWVCQYILLGIKGMTVESIEFDRWRINDFKAAAKREGLYQHIRTWNQVGQGYHDMSPRIEAFETQLLKDNIAHGQHPLMNMSAANAIVVKDPAGNSKIDKAKSTQRIDPLVAAVMGVYPLTDGAVGSAFDPAAMIG